MGRRDIKVYALLAMLTLGGTAVVSGLVAPSLPVAPFLVWGGSATVLIAGTWLFRLYGSVPAIVAAAEGSTLPPREFLPPEITPQILAEKVEGRTSLQVDGITKTYAGKWVRYAGVVRDVSESVSTYFLQIDCGAAWTVGVSLDKGMHVQLMALNVGDWVEIEGRISKLRWGLGLSDGVILHVGPPPKPKKPSAPRKTRTT